MNVWDELDLAMERSLERVMLWANLHSVVQRQVYWNTAEAVEPGDVILFDGVFHDVEHKIYFPGAVELVMKGPDGRLFGHTYGRHNVLRILQR